MPDGRGFVAAEVVHDDDVAGFENRHELLLDIGPEALPIDRAVEDAGCGEPIAAKGTQECQRTPVTMWGKGPQALAFLTPTPQWRHVGLDPGLINEHQPFGIEITLPGLPSQASTGDIGAGLFKSEQRFF